MTIAERIRRRVAALDWKQLAEGLDTDGYARIPALLTDAECRGLETLYTEPGSFRKTISMERHRFGQGEYKYFTYPLPPLVSALRSSLYPKLAAVANRWGECLGNDVRYPRSLRPFLAHCHKQGQARPTPLLLRYAAQGYNRLHQDLYGEVAFPLQLACLLSRPDHDFTGGEFLLVEQRPRMQSRGEAIPLQAGEGIVFATRERPVRGARGFQRAQMRHGVSRIRSGQRTALGIIFHDAH
jgi:hypothetical protein